MSPELSKWIDDLRLEREILESKLAGTRDDIAQIDLKIKAAKAIDKEIARFERRKARLRQTCGQTSKG